MRAVLPFPPSAPPSIPASASNQTSRLKKQFPDSESHFLYLAHNAPHTLIQPPLDWFEKVMDREKAPKKYNKLFDGLMDHVYTTGTMPWQREANAAR